MKKHIEISTLFSRYNHCCFKGFAGVLTIMLLLMCALGCHKKTDKDISDEEEASYQAIPTVCIWDKISARKVPVRNTPVISSLSLGETVTFLGTTAIDSTYKNQEYLHVRLSDGSLVWVPAFSLITDSKPAVVCNEVNIYLRPDMLTVTDKKLTTMDIIAVVEERDGWINFVSDKKTFTGWILEENINYSQEEIAFALIAKRILTEKTDKPLLQKLDSVLDYNPYQNSVFVHILREIREQEFAKKQFDDTILQNLESVQ